MIRRRPPFDHHRPGTHIPTREPIRQSLNRYYKSRTDPTRTRGARRASKARRQAQALKGLVL